MTRLMGLLLVGLCLMVSSASAAPRRLAWTPPVVAYQPPGANLQPVGPVAEPQESVTGKWWFWAAVGGVVAATVVVILVAGGAPPAPKSTLGNMEGFRGD